MAKRKSDDDSSNIFAASAANSLLPSSSSSFITSSDTGERGARRSERERTSFEKDLLAKSKRQENEIYLLKEENRRLAEDLARHKEAILQYIDAEKYQRGEAVARIEECKQPAALVTALAPVLTEELKSLRDKQLAGTGLILNTINFNKMASYEHSVFLKDVENHAPFTGTNSF